MATPDLKELERLLTLCETPAGADLPPDYDYARLSRRARQDAFLEAFCRMECVRAIASAYSWAEALTRREDLLDEAHRAHQTANRCVAALMSRASWAIR